MKIKARESMYQEASGASELFRRHELRRLRLLLRRLRYLESQLSRMEGALSEASGGSGGAVFVEWEAEALEWILTDVGYLQKVA